MTWPPVVFEGVVDCVVGEEEGEYCGSVVGVNGSSGMEESACASEGHGVCVYVCVYTAPLT
jgi:hypothetical protein